MISTLDCDEHLNEQLGTNGNDREKVVIKLIKSNPYISYDEVPLKLKEEMVNEFQSSCQNE